MATNREYMTRTNETFWDGLAEAWSERAQQSPSAAPETLNALRERLRCEPGASVLDAGCGAGAMSIALAAYGYSVEGIDLSGQMIAQAETAARQDGGPRPHFQQGDVTQLPFADAAFDAIICRNVLDFTYSPGAALMEFWRVLRPGKRLVLMMLGAHSPVKYGRWRRFLPEQHPQYGDTRTAPQNSILPWEMEALLTELHWRIIAQHPFHGRNFSGAVSPYSQAQLEALPDRVLQQAVATTWEFVLEKPVG